jgi:hypothetical protein
MFLRNVDKHLPGHFASQHRKPQSEMLYVSIPTVASLLKDTINRTQDWDMFRTQVWLIIVNRRTFIQYKSWKNFQMFLGKGKYMKEKTSVND